MADKNTHFFFLLFAGITNPYKDPFMVPFSRFSIWIAINLKAQDLQLLPKFDVKYFTLTALHSADKFSNEQQIF